MLKIAKATGSWADPGGLMKTSISAVAALGLAIVGGCASVATLLPGGVAAHVGTGTAAAAAARSGASMAAHAAASELAAAPAPVIGGAFGVGAMAAVSANQRMVGMSRANMEICAGFSGRVSEVLPDGVEKWIYERNACRATFVLKDGYVTKAEFSIFTCGSVVGRCL